MYDRKWVKECNKLWTPGSNLFVWKAANCTTRRKLRVSRDHPKQTHLWVRNLSKLFPYQAMLKKIDAFHLRGLRSILGLETTVVRRNISEFVLRTASDHSGHEIEIPLFSDLLLLKKRIALAGHISRTNDSDPLRQTTYAPSTACSDPIGKRRVGGPRQQWRHFLRIYN